VNSLGNPALRLLVLERDPTSLEEALMVASRLEALGGCEADDSWDDWGRRRDKFSRTAVSGKKDDDKQQLSNLIRDLQKELKENRGEMGRLRRGVREAGELSRRSGGAPAPPLVREWRDGDRSTGEEAPTISRAILQQTSVHRYRRRIRLDTTRH